MRGATGALSVSFDRLKIQYSFRIALSPQPYSMLKASKVDREVGDNRSFFCYNCLEQDGL